MGTIQQNLKPEVMTVPEFFIILAITIVIGSIFYYSFGRKGPWGALWIFMVVLFLSALAGKYWITAAGTEFWRYAWFPLLFYIFIIGLLIGLVSPGIETTQTATRVQEHIISKRDEQRVDLDSAEARRNPESSAAAAAFGLFFWLLMLIFFTAVCSGIMKA